MTVEEAWRLSRVAYTEVVYRPALKASAGSGRGTPLTVGRSLAVANVNKLVFAAFTAAGAAFPFILYAYGIGSTCLTPGACGSLAPTLPAAVALSVMLVFGYVVLYAVQVLPSFVTSGAFAPMEPLPLPTQDGSLVAALTLLRTMDLVVAVGIAVQVSAAVFVTGSLLAGAVVLASSSIGILLAVFVALRLTRFFGSRVAGSGRTRWGGVGRIFLFAFWGLSVMSAVFLFDIASFAGPVLSGPLSHPGSPEGLLLVLLLPFSAGFLSATAVGAQFGSAPLAAALLGVLGATVLAALAFRRVASIVGEIASARPEAGGGAWSGDMSMRVRGQVQSYVLKDLRVASRNPATGFLFALPVFETIAVVLPVLSVPVVKVSDILIGAQVGAGFALFTAFLLVSVEDAGIERGTALPINEGVRTLSKSLVSVMTYLPVPIVLGFALATKATTFGAGLFIPAVESLSVFAACVVEVRVLKRLADAGRSGAERFFLGLGAGLLVLVACALVYVATFSLTGAHWTAFGTLSGACLATFVGAVWLLRRAS